MRRNTKGLSSFTMIYHDPAENRVSREIFASSKREAILQAQRTLQAEFGFLALLVAVIDTQEASR